MTRPANSLALLALLLPVTVAALTSDRDKPAYIEADRAEFNDKTGIGRYEGSVVLNQGTLHVEANTLVVHRNGGALARVIAEGEPAEFRQLPDDSELPMHGRALRVEYDVTRSVVILEGEARVWQGQDRFTGNRIVYDTAAGTVQAQGGEAGDDGRVRAIIHPKKENGEQ